MVLSQILLGRGKSSSDAALLERAPPQGLYLGNVSFSRIRVSSPRKAAARAAVDPAGPAPATIRSYIVNKIWSVEDFNLLGTGIENSPSF